MRNYNDRIEAAYLTSKRQGNLMRDRQRERSPHEDRRNRYMDEQYRYPSGDGNIESIGNRNDSYFLPGERRFQKAPRENHRGKGPRNYKRSDDRIKEVLSDTYCDHPYLDASGIEVEVKDSEVILSGWVDDRYAKRLAEDLAEDTLGVTNVENRIRVNEEKKESSKRERVNQEIV
jgi:hypothetical protein